MARPVFGQPYRPEPAPLPASGPILARCTDPARTFAIWSAAKPSAVDFGSAVVMHGTDGAPCYRCLALTDDGCHFLRDRRPRP